MTRDENLLFGVTALQLDLIDARKFADACAGWALDPQVPLADLLEDRGWLDSSHRRDVERLTARKLEGLAAARSNPWNAFLDDALAGVDDPALRLQIVGAPGPARRDGPGEERYERSHLHGRGGIGQVWLAHDRQLDRNVALKELKPLQSDDALARLRFLREAKITGMLEHPGIAPVYELVGAGSSDREPFYTMRFVRGRTLHEAACAFHEAARSGAPEPRAFRELLQGLIGVCQAVGYAHSRGVVHRDLKGHNIVLGSFGEVVVLDWGLAKVLGDDPDLADDESTQTTRDHSVAPFGADELTREGQMLGTPAYAAPEQVEGRLGDIDSRTDVYGLGGILYDLLTGKPPFQGKSTQEVLRRVVHEVPDHPRSLRPSASQALSAVCLKALAKRREDRYPSAAAFAAELEHWLADEPVAAYQEPIPTRIGRWIRRHRRAVGMLALIGVLAIAGLSAGLYYVNRERGRTKAALVQSDKDFGLARAAVDRYLSEITLSPDLRGKGLDQVRRRLLESAREFYSKFAEDHADSADVQRELGMAQYRLADIARELGDRRAAADHYGRALEILRDFVNRRPEELAAADDYASVCHDYGQHFVDGGEFEAAEKHLRESLALRIELRRRRPDDLQALKSLGQSRHGLGLLYLMKRDVKRAEPECREALDIHRTLLERKPGDAKFEEWVAVSLFNLASCQTSANPKEADARFVESIEHWNKADAASNGDLIWPQHPVNAHLNRGSIAYDAGRKTDAKKHWLDALALEEKLIERFPSRLSSRELFGVIVANLMTVTDASVESQKLLVKALEVQREQVRLAPDVAVHRQRLVIVALNASAVHHNLKDHAAALSAVELAGQTMNELVPDPASKPAHDDMRIRIALNRSTILSRLHRNPEALAVAKEAASLEGVTHRNLMVHLALLHGRMDRPREAVRLLAETPVSDNERPDVVASRASVLAQAARSVAADASLPTNERDRLVKQYVDSAMGFLRAAADRNAFDDAAAMLELKSDDPDLAFLRSRKEFADFLTQLERRAPEKTRKLNPSN